MMQRIIIQINKASRALTRLHHDKVPCHHSKTFPQVAFVWEILS